MTGKVGSGHFLARAAAPDVLGVADQEAQAVRDRRALTLTLIVVSGAPGTGKSTIADALGAALRFPVLTLDPVKEALADVLGLGGEDWSNRVGDAAAEVVFRLASAFPDAVAEGWWRGARRERARAEFGGAIEVFCHCDPRLASDRAAARIGHGRHPIHRDVINPAMADRVGLAGGVGDAAGLGAALVEVDTGTPGASERAVAAVRAVAGRITEGCLLAWCTWSSTRPSRPGWPGSGPRRSAGR